MTAVQRSHQFRASGGSLEADAPAAAGAIPRLVITEQPEHGVTLYAARLAGALGGHPVDGTRAHAHFTDRLWGETPDAAATAFEHLSARAPVTVTLHDVPQPSDGEASLARRADCYRRVVAAASGVVCNSGHEVELLRRFSGVAAEAAVIPLPVDPVDPVADGRATVDPVMRGRAAAGGSVAVLGYVYPGKGHEQVIRAAAEAGGARALRSDASDGWPEVEALGRASDGHDRDVEKLAALAASVGVGFEVTGYLSDDELLARSRRAGVPVIAHEHVSASGSLASWLSAGRRPVVVASPYMEEMARLHPGAITLTPGHGLADAIARALADPASTWLAGDVRLGPTTAEVAELYRAFWAEVRW
ncbi:hypothetical protein ACEXQB_003230 [Herbiconiux sp. P18]|uniref:hypothetical protein n=1 Tax=Herbiconiux liangxiaofengii TaxID=3342795 RepID=UPI0035BA0CC0